MHREQLDYLRVCPHTYNLCYVCGGEHYLDNRPNVLEADARLEALEAGYQKCHAEPVELLTRSGRGIG